MAFNVRKLLIYDVKLLTIGHETNFKFTVPPHGNPYLWTSLPSQSTAIWGMPIGSKVIQGIPSKIWLS